MAADVQSEIDIGLRKDGAKKKKERSPHKIPSPPTEVLPPVEQPPKAPKVKTPTHRPARKETKVDLPALKLPVDGVASEPDDSEETPSPPPLITSHTMVLEPDSAAISPSTPPPTATPAPPPTPPTTSTRERKKKKSEERVTSQPGESVGCLCKRKASTRAPRLDGKRAREEEEEEEAEEEDNLIQIILTVRR